MSSALKTLSNIRSLRVLSREVSLEQLESFAEKLAIVIEEKRESVKAQELENAKRIEGLNKYKDLLAKDGFSVEELAEFLGSSVPERKREPRPARPAKYKFTDEFGNEKTWTGQGRTPLVLQKALAEGKTLADFEI